MKQFDVLDFDPAQCRTELDAFQNLLGSKQELSERDDLLPLFQNSRQLSAFIGSQFPDIGPANRIAYEFQIFGDFAADLVIGNFERKTFCAIELEDASTNSLFNKPKGKATSEWGRRFDGFSQLVDWFFSFDDYKQTAGFGKHFGYGHIEFFGLLLIGRSNDVSEYDRRRLRWHETQVSVSTHKIYCRTYDDLYEALDSDWRLLSLASNPG